MLRTVALTLLFVISCSASAENWPRFRGPNGQGISAEKNIPVKWSETENVAWKIEIPGDGWSSPVVHGDRVFVTSATDGGKSCHVICVDRKSGKVLWNTKVFEQETLRKERMNSYATPTPVTDGERVYAVFASGSIVAVDNDGKVLWTNRDNRFYSQHGLGASPILHEDLLIMPFDHSAESGELRVGWQTPWDKSYVLALDKNTGKQRWKAMRGLSRIAHVTPAVLNVNGKDQLISGAGDVVQGYDPTNGTKLWQVRSEGEGVTPSVVLGGGLVFTSSGFGGSPAPAIRATKPTGSGEVTATHIAWEQREAPPMIPTMIYANDLLFSVKENGIALCLDPKDGSVVWKDRLEGKYAASPVFAEGRLYFMAEDARVTVIEASRTFKVIGENAVTPVNESRATPAISQGSLFLRTNRHLYRIGKD